MPGSFIGYTTTMPTLNPSRLTSALGIFVMLTGALCGCATSGASDNPVVALLNSMAPPTPTQAAHDMVNPFDPDKRRNGVAWLSSAPYGGEEVYVRTYRLLLTDEDSTVRAAAAHAIGLHGQVQDAEPLARLMDDRAEAVRWEAAKALQKIHNPKAVDALIKHTRPAQDENADVRMASCQALGQYAEPRVFDALVGALADNDYSVVSAARGSLDTLTGYELGTDASLWLIWQKKNNDKLFASRREYTWKPFEKPPTTLDKLQFWKERKKVEPQKPTGIETANAGTGTP